MTLLCNKLSGQSGYNARIARSTCYEPNVGLDESGHLFMSMADGDDEIWMETKNLSSDKLHLL